MNSSITDECPPGTKEVSGFCVLCDYNTYQPYGGTTECKPCPGGGRTNSKGAKNEHECEGS